MPPESDHNSPSERVLSAIDSLRTAYYGVKTDNPWRADSAKELLESLTKDLNEEDIKSMEDTVNAVLKTRPPTITEKITTRATKGGNNELVPAKSSLKQSSPIPAEYQSPHDLYDRFQLFKKEMGLDKKTVGAIRTDAENLQDQITNVTIQIAELKQNKTKDKKDAADGLKKLSLSKKQLLIQKKPLDFVLQNPNGMNPKMHLFLDAGQTQKELKDWDRQQLPPIFRILPNFIIRFITRLHVYFSSDFNKKRKDEEKRLVESTESTVNDAIKELNVEATQDFTVVDAIKDTALAMQTVANTLNTLSVAMTETTATGSPSTETPKKGVQFNETTTTLNPENESTLTATTKLARAILRSQFTKDDMGNLIKMRSEIYNKELTKLQKSNQPVGNKPTEEEEKQAIINTRNLFKDAEQEVQKMITEDNGTRAIACLADTIESQAGEIEKRNSKDAVDKKNPSYSIPRTEAVEKTYESLRGWAPKEGDNTSNNNPWSTQYQNIQWSSEFPRESETQSNNQQDTSATVLQWLFSSAGKSETQSDTFENFWKNNSSLIYGVLEEAYNRAYLKTEQAMHNDRITRITTQLESIAKSVTAISKERNSQTIQKTDNLTEANWRQKLTQTLRPHQSDNWHKWDKQALKTYQNRSNFILDHVETNFLKSNKKSVNLRDMGDTIKMLNDLKEEHNQNLTK